MSKEEFDKLKNNQGKWACSYCDEGMLSPSKLEVFSSKRLPNESLASCGNCGRCFLVDPVADTQRIYPDLFDYRVLQKWLGSGELHLLNAERVYLMLYRDDVNWSAFKSAFEVARRFSTSVEKSEDQNRLFE